MPAQRPSAAFDPIPPNLDLAALVEETENFEYVTRVSCNMIESQSMEAFEKLVLLHVILGGKPLVIEGFQHRMDEWTFTSQWLKDNCGSKFENARNLTKQAYLPLSIGHYLNNLSKLTDQWTPTNYKDPDRQRIYLKDIDCPPLWQEKLDEHVPPAIFYLNDCVGEVGGPGAPDVVPTQNSGNTKGRGIARAGDLMSSLPPSMRAENLMCYIGHEGTYTPAHREMCASLGQNLMVETSGTIDEEGKPSKPGSSIWFMTESNDRQIVAEYWLSKLGHDIEVEKHFAQINAWKAAPFRTYIVEQKIGDFILIPPLAPHQVWNRGTRTMKVAWNRTTVETLELALKEALPNARMVCRDEQYKNKAIVYFTLQKYSHLLDRVDQLKQNTVDEQYHMDLTYNNQIRQLQKDFRRLFSLYTQILLSEMLAPVSPNEKKGQYLPYDSFVTCSYCRCNIFNRFLTCENCVEPLANGDENTYDICMDCFAMGRSCSCVSDFKWVEQFPWQELTERHETWRHQIIAIDGGLNDRSPRSLQRERKTLGKKTLAQVCQEQLKLRPFNDPKNPTAPLSISDVKNLSVSRAPEKDAENVSPGESPKKSRADRLQPGFVLEHVGNHPREAWKCAKCTKCDRSYQYGSLWRMFDLMPQTVMEDLEWECPACRKTCSCGSCRRRLGNVPYEPRGTVLGHDTKKVADARSVESLVDFGHSNLHFIKKTGDDHPTESRRLGRRIDEAARAKAQDPTLSDDEVVEVDDLETNEQFYEDGIRYTTGPDIPIDPMLSAGQADVPTTNSTVAGNKAPNGTQSKPARRGRGSESDGEWNRRQSSAKKKSQSKPKNQAKPGNQAKKGQQSTGSSSIYGSGISLRPPTGSAPLADMGALDAQDPDYQYPDPNVSHSAGASNHVSGSNRMTANAQHADMDLNHHDTNSQFQQIQVQRSLKEAKRNNRSIIAEAALSGKTLPVTLAVGRLGMALISDRLAGGTQHPNGQAVNVNKELLESDLPSVDRAQKKGVVTKKRKLHESDLDDDFSTTKRRDRKASAARPLREERTQAKEKEMEDFSESSDSELPEVSFAAVNKPRGPRRLPKYLADQHADGDLPAELPQEPARRRTSQGEKYRSGRSNGAGTSTARGSNGDSKFTSAQKSADENRRAKQKAVQWADVDGKGDDAISDDVSSTSRESPVHQSVMGKVGTTLMKVPESMFSRMGGRKKIKVTAAKVR